MMLTVGVDSYISAVEALELLSGDKLQEKFAALETVKQEHLLKRAAERIELLPLTGRKKSMMQYMSFPRFGQAEIPQQVKAAQAAEAAASLDEEAESRLDLQAQGVTGVTLGQVSESYSGTIGSSQSRYGLHSERAYSLLRKYIAGGFPIV